MTDGPSIPLPNCADPEQINASMAHAKYMADRDVSDLVWVLSSAQGRRAITKLIIETCGITRTTYDHDPIAMAANAATANVGLQILSQITAINPDIWLQMQAERIADKKAEISTLNAKRLKTG